MHMLNKDYSSRVYVSVCWELDVAKLLTVYIIVNLFILCIIASYFLLSIIIVVQTGHNLIQSYFSP